MITTNQIKPDAPVVCSKNTQFGIVDHLEGPDTIKLKKDKSGQHHYIPMSWVSKVDDKVHVDRPGEQCMREWSSVAPQGKTNTSQTQPTSPQGKTSTSQTEPTSPQAKTDGQQPKASAPQTPRTAPQASTGK